LIDEYNKSPKSSRDETPQDWGSIRNSIEGDPTSIYGVIFMKPKHRRLLLEGANLAALRQTSQTGLAVVTYQRKHGTYPERLEQLVPEFLPAAPIDPRDGQPLRMKRDSDMIVIYAVQDAATVDSGKLKDPDGRDPAPIFRLHVAEPKQKP